MMTQMDTTSSAEGESVAIAVLDLPLGSILGLDGQSIQLQRDDFVGIKGIPTSNNSSNFHLIITRAAACGSKEEQKHGNVAAVSVGFVVLQIKPQQGTKLALVRRYDHTTEEVSSKLINNATISNLNRSIKDGGMEPQRMISFGDFVSAEQSTSWGKLTCFISERLLSKRGIQNGSKIVPGSYGEDNSLTETTANPVIEDGSSARYPPIPVLDGRKSARQSRHEGAKQFLAALTPSDRTSLFLHENPNNLVMETLLKQQFDSRWQDLLGDIQLSYILFLHLQCLSSLEHWRDLVAMLSNVDCDCAETNSELYCELLRSLAIQVTAIEEDFFEDIEMSGDNFLVPALQKLCNTTGQIYDNEMQTARAHLCKILENRFSDAFHSIDGNARGPAPGTDMQVDGDGDDDNENKPVVVSNEEVEAASARSSQSPSKSSSTVPKIEQFSPSIKKKYPMLFAAKLDHEDILMTCSRALDAATDVSLVREAGTFLVEEVEPDMDDMEQ